MALKKAQEMVDRWINEHGVRYFDVQTNTLILMEEVGEFARIVARKYGEQSFKEEEKDSDLSNEMADVLFVLLCLANQSDVDLDQALKANLLKKSNRDRDRHKANPKLKS